MVWDCLPWVWPFSISQKVHSWIWSVFGIMLTDERLWGKPLLMPPQILSTWTALGATESYWAAMSSSTDIASSQSLQKFAAPILADYIAFRQLIVYWVTVVSRFGLVHSTYHQKFQCVRISTTTDIVVSGHVTCIDGVRSSLKVKQKCFVHLLLKGAQMWYKNIREHAIKHSRLCG